MKSWDKAMLALLIVSVVVVIPVAGLDSRHHWSFVPRWLTAMGSYFALMPVVVAALVTVVRTALEDRTLHEELKGYREYAARVRYKLIPGLW